LVQQVNLNNIASDFMIAPLKKTANMYDVPAMGTYFHFNSNEKEGLWQLNEFSKYLTGFPFMGFLENSLKQTINTSEQITTEDSLFIGGEKAGIQAALEIAQSNHKVCLRERKGTIGDREDIYDKTFPTLNCAACFLTPKIAETRKQHIHGLQTHSDLITSRIRRAKTNIILTKYILIWKKKNQRSFISVIA
jgi:hypothetical protein